VNPSLEYLLHRKMGNAFSLLSKTLVIYRELSA
jgi:hypothetical protein